MKLVHAATKAQRIEIDEHLRHREDEDGKRERDGDPESTLHVDVFRIRSIVERYLFRLERHPADRTTSGSDLDDLGMHRAGELDLGFWIWDCGLWRTHRYRRWY
jgi:hypothetical protein